MTRILELESGPAAFASDPVVAVTVALLVIALVGVVALVVVRYRRHQQEAAGRLAAAALTTATFGVPGASGGEPAPVLPSSARPAPDLPAPGSSTPVPPASGSSTSGAVVAANGPAASASDDAVDAVDAVDSVDRALTVLPGKPMPRRKREDAAMAASSSDQPPVAPESVAPEPVGPESVVPEPVVPEPVATASEAGPVTKSGRKPRARRTPAPARDTAQKRPAPGRRPVPEQKSAPEPVEPVAQDGPDGPGERPVLERPVLEKSVLEKSVLEKSVLEKSPAVAPKPRSKPASSARRPATKRQQTRLAELTASLGAINGRIHLAEVATQEALDLVTADTAALVVHGVAGARVLAASPQAAGAPAVWGVRTLIALLARSEPVRLVLDGDPLSGGARISLLTVPVPAGGRSAGVLICRRHSARAFSASDEDALNRLARICGERLHRTPERVAVEAEVLDRETGLAGPDLLRHDLTDALRARSDHDLPVTLIVAEVLGLSRLRTASGMAAADAALASVARQVDAELRVGDLIYRLSADELAVLLPATDLESATTVAERLAGLTLSAVDGVPDAALALRAVAVAVKGEVEAVLLSVSRRLKARRVAERWSGSGVVQPSTI